MRRYLPHFLTIACLGTVLPGCTPEQYARQADRAAYGALTEGQRVALGRKHDFTVDYRPLPMEGQAGGGAILLNGKEIPMGDADPVVVNLSDCLKVAFRNSRGFQTRKESLFSSALALANSRRAWNGSEYGGSLDASASHTKVHDGAETNAGAAGGSATLTQRFFQGGVLLLGASLDLATDFVGGSDTTIGSLLEGSFTQPLLRGAWRGLAYEDQYRRERDFVFNVFAYERFTQTFAADIVTRYYAVLRQRDQLENERESIRRLEATVKETKVKVDGGQVSRIQLDQAEQNLINAQIRFQRNMQDYEDALDGFKLFLGLPVPASIAVDYPGDLEMLTKVGPRPIPFEEAEAVEVALSVRPDVLTQRASLRDAERDVEIAADDFNPRLDVEVGLSVPSKEDRTFWELQAHRHTRSVGVTFNYPIDQTDNRDAYRNALIAHDRARRDYEEFIDNVRLDVRQSYRSLVQSKRSYELQVENVKLARRRLRLAVLEQQHGLASARDRLEAEDALRNAQNGLTAALVQYTTTRLEFLAQLGMIWVDDEGQVHERRDPFKFDRLGQRYD